MTDLYHGNHYDVIMLPRGTSGAAIHGAHSTEFKDSDDLGCLPISRKVPVEAQFETPAIVREMEIMSEGFVLANTRYIR